MLVLVGVVAAIGMFVLPAATPPASHAAQQDDAEEAVFRYQIAHDLTAMGQRPVLICPSLDRPAKLTDLSDAFIRRFADLSPPVRKASDCAVGGSVSDPLTGRPALLYSLTEIEWSGPDAADLQGGPFK